MSKDTEEHIRAYTIGELNPLSGRILIVDYDPCWPELFKREADRIRATLGPRALRIEHTGSTSVAGLAAKPIIDVLLVVTDSSDEDAYIPALASAGYLLRSNAADRDLYARSKLALAQKDWKYGARHKNGKHVGTYEKPSRDRQEALSELEN